MIRRISKLLALALLATLFSPVAAPNFLETSEAAANKTTICHRTHSIKNPYRMITVSQSAVSNGHSGHNEGIWTTSSVQGDTWGDIIPDQASGGPNNKETNWTDAGRAIYNGITINPNSGAPACKKISFKVYYDAEIEALRTPTEIATELNQGLSEEDSLLLKTLPGSPTSFTSTNLSAAADASTSISVTTLGATSVSTSSPWVATLNGSVKTDSTSLSCQFEYDTNSGFSNNVTPTTAESVPINATTSKSATITGLRGATLYYYRFECYDSANNFLYGATFSFTTGTNYSITYDSNSADTGSVPIDGTLYAPSATAYIRGNEGTLAKTGYSFAGWTDNIGGTGTVYAPSGGTASITINSNKVFYAKWTPATYTVTFNGNGNTGGAVPSNQTKTYNVSLTLSGNTGSLAKTGHTFAGWNTLSGGGGTSYAAGASYTTNAGATLYAQWTPDTYTVTYNGNGNTGGAVPADQTKTYNVSLTLSGNTGSLAKTGYTFSGWNTLSGGGGTSFSGGGSYTTNAGTTLYAQWTLETYTVTFNGNGNTGGAVPSNQTKTYNVSLTLSGNIGSLAKTGHTFAGWNTLSGGGGTSFSGGGSYTTNAGTTLYAQWTPDTYTVTYNGNGNTGGAAPADQTKTYNVTLVLNSNSGSLTNGTSTFSGWNTEALGGGTSYGEGANYTANVGTTLYAQWTSASLWNVTYNGNGNSGGSAPGSQTVTRDAALNLQTNSGNLTRTGYTFSGWATQSGGGGTSYSEGERVTPTGNLALYAKWTATTFPVIFSAATATSGSMSNQTFTAGTAQGLTVNAFNKTGYTFAGWATSSGGSVVYTDTESITLYETTTVYAKWTATTFPVIFSAATATSGSMSNQTFTAGTAQGLTANAFNKTGYTFAGWATSSGGSVVYTDTESITLYETITVYGKWTGNNLTVRFFANSGSGSMSNQTIVAGTATAIAANTFTYSGYSFTGWNTVAGGTGTAYTNSESVTLDSDLDLYALWSSVPTYTVTYTAGGGSGTVPTQSALTSGATFLTGSGSGLSRSSYTFAGWSCNSGSTIGVGVSVTMSSAAMTCVAQWTANSSGGGGSSSSSSRTPGSGNATSAAASTKLTPVVVKKTATLVTLATTPVKTTVVSTPVAVSTPAATGSTPSTPSAGGNTSTPGNSGSTPAATGTTPSSGTTASGDSGSTPSTGGTTTTPGNSSSTTSTGGTTAPGNSGNTPSTGGTTERINVNNTQLSQTTTITSTAAKSVTFTGVGITQATVVNNEVAVQAKPGFSGKTTVKITVTTEEEISTIIADVLVIPLPVTNPVVKVVSDTKSRIQWIRSPNAVTYEVTQNGKLLCTTAGTICTVAQAVSADAPVQIKALGRDQTESTVKQASYVAAPSTPVVPEIALVVNFDTAKYNLDSGDRALIRAFAADVVKYGFTKIDISGHTDSRGGIDNNVLSNNRAKAARAYLLSLLPNLKVTINGYADAISVATNATAEGMTANRRAEFRVVG